MSIEPADDRLHLPATPDAPFRDVVTFSFGDPAAKLYGLARVSHGSEGSHGAAVLYAGRQSVVAGSGGGHATDDPTTWESVIAGDVRVQVHEPLASWSVRYAGEDGGFDLRFEACSAPAGLDLEGPVARAGAIEGYDQLCRVSGTASHGGRMHQVRCLGQRGQAWGDPTARRIELERTVCAWLGDDRALTLTALRPAKSKGHFDEALSGFMFEDGKPVKIADPRLSTTYDGELRVRRAGLELWMDDEGEHGHRVAGEALCGTSLDLGEQRLESAFFAWRMEGRSGVGRYDVLRQGGSLSRGSAGARRKRSR